MTIPVIPSSSAVFYVFGFASAGAAGDDLVVGTLRGQEVLLYFADVSTVEPMVGYQSQVTQYGPVDPALYSHSALLFAYALGLSNDGSILLLTSNLTDDQIVNLILILSNYGLLLTGRVFRGAELREDGGFELREDGGVELRQ